MNSTPTDLLSGSPTPDDFDALVDRFERAWRGGTTPDLAGYLPAAETVRRPVLEELIKIDLEYRWRAAPPGTAGALPARPLLEDYLRRYPELAELGETPAALVEEEYRVRQRWGDRPDIAEYVRRFPHLAGLEATLRAADVAIAVEARQHPSPPPATRYERRHRHATGGLGEVWLAHDRLVGRDVALKELRPELAHQPNLRRRFLQEARLTGRLEHPGIVPLYEMTEPSGERGPFYVMRFLHGRTLGEAIREQQRDGLRPLLTAFVSVCNAVAYAHSRGVVHRDLKPANVLVGNFGEVIVLDWGLAKVSGEADDPLTADTEAAPGLTRQGQVLGTPAYMAPEQAAGDRDRINARTDVFGLGAILYEILTGRAPYSGGSIDETLTRAREGTPSPPRRVRGDVPAALDAVCRNALAHDPNARYASARELADDVQRWLADEPVSAYRDPLSIRLFRHARRHRTAVASLAVLLLCAVVGLSVGAVLLAREQARTQEARTRAEANFRRAMSVVDRFCTRVSEETLLDEPGLQPLRKQLLGDALDFYREFVADPSADASARAELGRAHWRLGDLLEALEPGPASQQHYLAAMEQIDVLTAAEPDAVQHRADAAGVRHSLGNWHLQRHQLGEAEFAFRDALERRALLAKEHPDVSELCRDVARTHNNLGVVYRQANRLDDAAGQLRTVVNLFEGLSKREPNEPEHRFELARARVNLGSVKRARNDRGDAATEYQQAATTLERLAGGRPAWRATLAAAYNNHGELTRSEKSLRRALELLTVLAAESPSVGVYRRDLAKCQFNLAGVLAITFRRREAEKLYAAAVEAFDRLAREQPTVPEHALDLGMSCQTLASLHALSGQTEAVIAYADRAVAALDPLTRDKRFPSAAGLVRGALVQRATARMKLGRFADAARDWDRFVELDGGKTPRAYLLDRAGSLARSGQHARATSEVEAMLATTSDGAEFYDLACLLSLSAAAVRADAKLSQGDREPLATRLSDRAVGLLERSFDAGYLKRKSAADHLRDDSDLNPIHAHVGFVRLLDKLPR